MNIKITAYNAVCCLGNSIEEAYEEALKGNNRHFSYFDNFIQDKWVYLGAVKGGLPQIEDENYNIRCNRLILKTIESLCPEIERVIKKYGRSDISVISASSNSGVQEYAVSKNPKHYMPGNPAEFLHKYLGLKGYYAGVSAACSSGIKAFSAAQDLLNSGVCSCVIIVCTDALSKVPIYGFNSLGVLSEGPSLPFSKNRAGMNIGEGCAVFILEKGAEKGITIMGIGESTDITHMTSPDINAEAAIKALRSALKQAGIEPDAVDYINAHGTGTIANDIMEARAINAVFGANTPAGAVKPLTGHCLGAAAGAEAALCCRLLDDFRGSLLPHIYDGVYDETLPEINLAGVNEKFEKCRICLCSSFGFGGADAAMILGKI